MGEARGQLCTGGLRVRGAGRGVGRERLTRGLRYLAAVCGFLRC